MYICQCSPFHKLDNMSVIFKQFFKLLFHWLKPLFHYCRVYPLSVVSLPILHASLAHWRVQHFPWPVHYHCYAQPVLRNVSLDSVTVQTAVIGHTLMILNITPRSTFSWGPICSHKCFCCIGTTKWQRGTAPLMPLVSFYPTEE